MSKIRTSAVMALSAAVALAAATPLSSTMAAPHRHAASCFWTRSVDSFRSIDNQTVYVRVSGRDVYELKLFAPCQDVDWAHHIGLRSRGSSNVCEGKPTTLEIYVRSIANRQRCPVDSVRHLSPEEVRALPAAARP